MTENFIGRIEQRRIGGNMCSQRLAALCATLQVTNPADIGLTAVRRHPTESAPARPRAKPGNNADGADDAEKTSTSPNVLFRAARERLFGTREALANAANNHLGKAFVLTANDIGKIERGLVSWPRPPRRAALREVLNAETDADIGLFNDRATILPPVTDEEIQHAKKAALRRQSGTGHLLSNADADAAAESPATVALAKTATATKRTRLVHRRKAVGHTQETLAQSIDVERSTVVRWESGNTEPQPWIRGRLAAALKVTTDALDDLLDEPRIASNIRTQRVRRPAPAPLPPSRPDVEFAGLSTTAEEAIQTRAGDTFLSAVESFRMADRQVGGGFLYDTVVRYLRTKVAPEIIDVESGPDGEFAFCAAAALTEMAGWMAHDAGRDEAARHHFARSLDFAQIGRDKQLGVHVVSSISHLVNHMGQVPEAIAYAQQGRDLLAGMPRLPDLEARLLSIQARNYAKLGDAKECSRLLNSAEITLTARPATELSRWASPFDAGSLAGEAARCYRILGDSDQAQHHAERVIQLRPDSRARSRAFGQLILVAALIAKGRPEEACLIASEVLRNTEQLGSYIVMRQLHSLRAHLSAYKTNSAVVEFVVCLDDTLRRRQWLYEWSGIDSEHEMIGHPSKW